MKRILLVIVLVLVAGVVGVMRHGAKFERNQESRNDIRQQYELSAGARVEVSGINGFVRIETSDQTTASVEISVIGHSPEDVNDAATIEQTSEGLSVRGRRNGSSLFQRLWHGAVRQEVLLKTPRDIALIVRGVNGSVTSGAVNGTAQVSGVSGAVELDGTRGYTEVAGINGGVSLSVDRLDDKGIRVSGVNGGVVLRLSPNTNADVNAHGIMGKVRSEGLNFDTDDDQPRSRFSGRIGTGGAPINISGVNGGVKFIGTR